MPYASMSTTYRHSNINIDNNGKRMSKNNSSNWSGTARAINPIPAGKWYWEITCDGQASYMMGIAHANIPLTSYPNTTTAFGFYINNGYIYDSEAYGVFESVDQVDGKTMGIAFDTATGQIWISINGAWQGGGDPANGISTSPTTDPNPYWANIGPNQQDLWYPVATIHTAYMALDFNFGQSEFMYDVPEDFNAGVWYGDYDVLPNIDMSLGKGTYSYDQVLEITATSGTNIYYKDDGLTFDIYDTSFSDTSSATHTIIPQGSAKHTAEEGKFNSTSITFNLHNYTTSTDYLEIPASIDFNFGPGDFTIDFLLYISEQQSVFYEYILGQWESSGLLNSSWIVFKNVTTNKLRFQFLGTSGNIIVDMIADTAAVAGTWYHLAVVREGSTFTMYIDGTAQAALGTSSEAVNSSPHPVCVANYWETGGGVINTDDGDERGLRGYMSEIRISKGIARWSTNFTPPTVPYTNTAGEIDEYTTLMIQSPMTVISGSTLYTEPITISGTTHVEAISIDADKIVSTVISRDYTLDKTFDIADWDGGLSFSIDHNKVVSTEENFPLKLTLSSGTGQNNFDTSEVFDSLTTITSGHDIFTRYYQNYDQLDISGNNRRYKVWGTITENTPESYPYAIDFNGTSDRIQMTDYSDLAFGTDDFTIDAWIKTSVSSADPDNRRLISFSTSNSNNAAQIFISSNGTLVLYAEATNILESNSVVDDDVWYHVALVRANGTVKMYINGTSEDNASFTNNLVSNCCYIGRMYDNNGYWDGSIVGMRITKGEALWTANFTSPTGPEAITSNTKFYAIGTAEPSANSHIPYFNGAELGNELGYFNNGMYFDGSSYINVGDNTNPEDFNFHTEDFTVDWWEYQTAKVYGSGPLSSHHTIGAQAWAFYTNSSLQRVIYMSSNNSSWDISSNRFIVNEELNRWIHWAFTRDGNTFKVYKDGILQVTFTSSYALADHDNSPSIGRYNTGGYWQGYMSDVRISKGIVRWTSNFRPPTRSYKTIQYTPNDKKIAITTTVSGAQVQLPVEVAYWDAENKKADLWTRIPNIGKDLDTVIHLYYNKNNADNINFVGDSSSAVANHVWDDVYSTVFHFGYFLNVNPLLGVINSADSFFNASPYGDMTCRTDLIDESIIRMDGVDDYFEFYRNPLKVNSDDWSLTTHLKLLDSSTTGEGYVIFNGNGFVQADNYWSVLGYDDVKVNSSLLVPDSNFHTVTATKSGTDYYIYIDSVDDTVLPVLPNTNWGLDGYHTQNSGPVRQVGRGKSSARPTIEIDEVFIAGDYKGANWESMMYYNLNDSLFTVASGTLPDPRAFIFTGYVKVDTIFVQRTVNLYRRSNGNLVGTTQSDLTTGHFEIGSFFDEPHYVVVLPIIGEGYNLLGFDNINPETA